MTTDTKAPFAQFRRKQIAELRPWQTGDDMSGISISAEDTKAGSPKAGDMIARNPKNHADQWLVAAAYFADNFEPVSATPPAPTPSAGRAPQPFERYPALAAEIERMASTGAVGSLNDWQNFTDALNSALLPDAAAIRAAAFEEAAKIAERDCRTIAAKECGYEPDFHKHAKAIAAAIRAAVNAGGAK